MKHPPHIALLQRILGYIETKTFEMEERESAVPVARYTDEACHRGEVESLFRRHPIAIAHAGQIPEPGGCLAHDLLGVPLFLVRDEGGTLRAFLNVCRHRGNRLVDTAADGKACRMKSLVCRYHNWTYALDGALRHVPLQEEAFPNLDRAARGLVALPVEVRHGLVWVVPDPRGTIDLDAHLAGIGVDLDVFGMNEQVFYQQRATRVRTNWKLIIDGFLEGYHIRRLHSATVAPFFTDGLAAGDRVGRNLRFAVARREIAEIIGQPEDTWDDRRHVSFAYFLFPNTIMVFHPDYTSHLGMFPQGTDETVFVHTMVIPCAPRTEEEDRHWQRSFELIEGGVFQKEDLRTAEAIQAGLRSGANEALTLGRVEYPIRWFHAILDEAMGEADRE
ncbi:MAG: aromatic ring-hydroxylating dioxygenase subunit alpha [Deltaproteobacteria bacterium]|nr:aromatic ring-hydroxylating dioxygenase subunit alpha [Deltaproteobacteria bacterium]